MNTLNDYRPGYHGLVTGYIATKCKWTPDYANAVTADAPRFLAVCADHPGERLVSSEDIDEVVDTFVLDTDLLYDMSSFGVMSTCCPCNKCVCGSKDPTYTCNGCTGTGRLKEHPILRRSAEES